MKSSPIRGDLLDEAGSTILPGDQPAGVRVTNDWRPNAPNPLRDLERLAQWLDSIFKIPGLPFRFGIDALLGLFPGAGDTVTSVASLYIMLQAARMGVSKVTLTRMATNIGIDYVVGAIPLLGDFFDVYWKANNKNVELLQKHVAANRLAERRLKWNDWLFLGGLAAVLITLLVGSVTIAWFLVSQVIRLFRG